MTRPLEEQVRWLVAREEIRTVIARYAKAGDANNDPAVFRTIFCEDAVWEAEGFGRYEGRDEIVRELARIGQEQILWSLHFPVSPLIELDAACRSAHATWWLWELMTLREEGRDANKWLGATYDCDFVREADGWKMKHLNLQIQKLVDWPEGAEAPAERPVPTGD